MHCKFNFSEETFACMIGDRENDSERGLGLSEIELKATVEAAEVPPYLRFHLVQLSYLEADKGTAEERFAWFQMVFLPSLKHALIGSKFKFICAIEDEAVKRYGPTANGEESYYENSPADFEDSDTLLLHISSKLLPIFNQCCSYKFCITLPNKQAVISEDDIISEILQFDSVSRCSNVSFLLTHVNYNWPQCLPYLPVETIGNWLNRPLNAGQKQNKRLLQIKVEHDEIPNVYEMFENLEKVFPRLSISKKQFIPFCYINRFVINFLPPRFFKAIFPIALKCSFLSLFLTTEPQLKFSEKGIFLSLYPDHYSIFLNFSYTISKK